MARRRSTAAGYFAGMRARVRLGISMAAGIRTIVKAIINSVTEKVRDR